MLDLPLTSNLYEAYQTEALFAFTIQYNCQSFQQQDAIAFPQNGQQRIQDVYMCLGVNFRLDNLVESNYGVTY